MADKDYFIDSDKLYDYFPDSLITTDEWEDLRYKIVQEIFNCDDEDKRIDEFYLKYGLPFLRTFEFYLEKKLINSGFKREWLKNDIWLKGEAYSRRGDYDNPTIEAALSGLVSIRKLKDLLLPDGKVDKNSIKVFLYSLETLINLFRAGVTPELARSQVRTIGGSLSSRKVKQEILKTCLKQIFEKYPKIPKTLGGVWSKIDLIKTIQINVDGEFKTYNVTANKNDLFITGTDLKKPLKYAKTSIRRFIKTFK